MNESLRLSPPQIEEYKGQALAGDKEAAKKLWHHYAGVELNMEEAEKWRALYEGRQESQQQNSPTVDPHHR